MRRKQPEPEINVTPLVDVVLVLLIIFMVIAPAINQGEHVELPAILQPDAKPKDMNPIEVTLALNGNVLLDKERIEPVELEAKVAKLHQEDPDRALMLLTDEAMPYKRVRETFAKLQGMGFKGLSLKVTEKKTAGAS
jgi:biopolymer transport protein ExbD/biopolymer transport protein TolR